MRREPLPKPIFRQCPNPDLDAGRRQRRAMPGDPDGIMQLTLQQRRPDHREVALDIGRQHLRQVEMVPPVGFGVTCRFVQN